MEKIGINNTALAIFSVATAVVLIGGLALVPTTTQSASAERSGFGGGCGVGGCGGVHNDEALGGGGGGVGTGGYGSGGGSGELHRRLSLTAQETNLPVNA
jgi:hypothetical protein